MDFPIKAKDMLHKHDAWQNNVIATPLSVKDDTHHAWTSMSYHIIANRLAESRETAIVCVCTREAEAETITQSERNSTERAGVHSHSVCLSPDSLHHSEEQRGLPAGSACISQTRSF